MDEFESQLSDDGFLPDQRNLIMVARGMDTADQDVGVQNLGLEDQINILSLVELHPVPWHVAVHLDPDMLSFVDAHGSHIPIYFQPQHSTLALLVLLAVEQMPIYKQVSENLGELNVSLPPAARHVAAEVYKETGLLPRSRGFREALDAYLHANPDAEQEALEAMEKVSRVQQGMAALETMPQEELFNLFAEIAERVMGANAPEVDPDHAE